MEPEIIRYLERWSLCSHWRSLSEVQYAGEQKKKIWPCQRRARLWQYSQTWECRKWLILSFFVILASPCQVAGTMSLLAHWSCKDHGFQIQESCPLLWKGVTLFYYCFDSKAVNDFDIFLSSHTISLVAWPYRVLRKYQLQLCDSKQDDQRLEEKGHLPEGLRERWSVEPVHCFS